MRRRRGRSQYVRTLPRLQQLPGPVQLLHQQVAQARGHLGGATAHRLRRGEDRDRIRPRGRRRIHQGDRVAPVPGGPPPEELPHQGVRRQCPRLTDRARSEDRPGHSRQAPERRRVQPPGPRPRLHPPREPGERGLLRTHRLPYGVGVAHRTQCDGGRLTQLRPPLHRPCRIQLAGRDHHQVHGQRPDTEAQARHTGPRHLAQAPGPRQRGGDQIADPGDVGRSRDRHHQVQIGARQLAAHPARAGHMHPRAGQRRADVRDDRLGVIVPGPRQGVGQGAVRGFMQGVGQGFRRPAHLARAQCDRRTDTHRAVPAPRQHGEFPDPRGHRPTEARRELPGRPLRVATAPQRQMRGVAPLLAGAPPASGEPLRQRAPQLLPRCLTGRRRVQPERGLLTVPEAVHALQPGLERRGPGGHFGQQRHGFGEGGLRHEAEEQVHVRGPAPVRRVVCAAQVPHRVRQARRQPRHRRPHRRRHVEPRRPRAERSELHRRLHPEVVGDEQAVRSRGVAAQRRPRHPGRGGTQQDPVQPARAARQRPHRGQRIDHRVEGRRGVRRPVHLAPGVPHAERGRGPLGPVPAVVEVAQQGHTRLDAAQTLRQPGQLALPPLVPVLGVVAGQVGGGDDQRPGRGVHRHGGDRLVRAERVQARLPHRQPAQHQQPALGDVPAAGIRAQRVPGPHPRRRQQHAEQLRLDLLQGDDVGVRGGQIVQQERPAPGGGDARRVVAVPERVPGQQPHRGRCRRRLHGARLRGTPGAAVRGIPRVRGPRGEERGPQQARVSDPARRRHVDQVHTGGPVPHQLAVRLDEQHPVPRDVPARHEGGQRNPLGRRPALEQAEDEPRRIEPGVPADLVVELLTGAHRRRLRPPSPCRARGRPPCPPRPRPRRCTTYGAPGPRTAG